MEVHVSTLSHEANCSKESPCKVCQAVRMMRSEMHALSVHKVLSLLGADPLAFADIDLARHMDSFEISVRLQNGLTKNEVKTLGDAISHTAAEYLRSGNFGRKTLRELEEVLATQGLTLKR